MKIDTHKEAGPTKIVMSMLGKFHEDMRKESVRAKCKVRGEILERLLYSSSHHARRRLSLRIKYIL